MIYTVIKDCPEVVEADYYKTNSGVLKFYSNDKEDPIAAFRDWDSVREGVYSLNDWLHMFEVTQYKIKNKID